MSWFRTPQTTAPTYTGLQLQTSVSTLPIPIVWGQTKIAGNLLWYANFQAQGGNGGGKGFSQTPGGTTYNADVIIGLCEGSISTIGAIWKDRSVYFLSTVGLQLFVGTTPQSVWGYLATASPSQALAYQGTAYVCAASYPLDSSAGIASHNFEVAAIIQGTGVNGIDADPALVISDLLTNPQYGVGFSGASIDATTLLGASGDASLQTYCKAMNIAFSPALINQEQASSILTRWLQLLNCAAVWSGGKLKFIPYGDTAIAGGVNKTVKSQVAVPTDGQSFQVCLPSQWVSDGGVVYAYNNAPFTYIGTTYPSAAGQYGISPNGVYLFSTADMGVAIVITFTYTLSTSYAPNVTPVYALTDTDFIDDSGNSDPVKVSRLDPFSLPNVQRLECLSRENQYSLTAVEARDQGQIDLFGPRVGSTIQAHEICDPITIGPIVAQTILQRGLYIRAHYAFTLGWEYCLLDPMDIVTISDANLGLTNCAVRILSIEEDDKGLLTVTAEELTVGISTAPLYPNAAQYGYRLDQNVAAKAVNYPLIYEPPPSLTNGTPQIWLGASGASADPNWGGAYVWVSTDNATYSQIAIVTQRLRQGVLSASLPNAPSGLDAADTLKVDLTRSGGTLSGTSASGAAHGATLSLVGKELLGYQVATLTGANAYNLTNLWRGLSGTTPRPHGLGDRFFRLDGAVIKYTLPADLVGQTLYFKFQSFNVFGLGMQSLAACTAYPYTPSGGGAAYPIAAQLLTGAPLDLGDLVSALTLADDFGATASAATGAVDLGAVSVVANPIGQQLISGVALDLGSPVSWPTLSDDFGATSDAVVDVINLGTVP